MRDSSSISHGPGDLPEHEPTEASPAEPPPLYEQIDAKTLRRSLWLSGIASALGSIFITAIQGSVFNFFIEDAGLKPRLGFFMGIAGLAGIGSLLGAWVQERFGCRKGLFLWGIAGSRLVWLPIALIPIFWPELQGQAALWPLAGLVLLFFITHSMGANAWLSWMAELVPPHLSGRYWGLRQVGCSAAGAAARFGFGFWLDLHHHPYGYLAIFGFAVFVGVVDALLFLGVAHRAPKQMARERSVLKELGASLREPGLRRLSLVYMLWMCSNCVMAPTCFRFLRDHVGLGVFSFSVVEMLALGAFTVFSFLWGSFSDRYGHRGGLVMCLLVHGLCPIAYFLAGPGDFHLAALAFVFGSIGFCGIRLFMMPMLIGYTDKKTGGSSVGMAAFMLLMGLPGFFVFWSTDEVLHPLFQRLTGAETADARVVYLALFALCMALRAGAVATAWALPERGAETPPGTVIRMFATTNPLAATMHLIRYVTFGPREGEEGPFAPVPAPVRAESACGSRG